MGARPQVVCGGADDARVSKLEVRRWTRYGHDRLYVQTADGARLGYWDCKTGAPVIEPAADRASFDAVIAAYLGAMDAVPYAGHPAAPG